jgi:hypothetical protein
LAARYQEKGSDMDMQEMEIRVDREGNVAIHVCGIKGEECTRITRTLEEALGILEERTFTGEFYEEERTIGSHEKTGIAKNPYDS